MLPLKRRGRGGLDGAVDGVEVLRFAGDSSSELLLRTAEDCRGRWRRAAGGEATKLCQKDAHEQEKEKGGFERAQCRRISPREELLAGGDGGGVEAIASSLGAAS